MSSCGPGWKMDVGEFEKICESWTGRLKREPGHKPGYANVTKYVSCETGANPPAIALVSFADGFDGGFSKRHFGGRVQRVKTVGDRDYYQVIVYID